MDGLSSTLYIYGSDAQLIDAIRLPSDMRHPRHAVETSSGSFIICHGWKDDSLNRVCEMTKDGRIIRSYTCHPVEIEHGQLNTPLHVATDVEGHVYVCFNYRVLILNSSLGLQRVIQTQDELVGGLPWSVCYSKDTGQLIVGSLFVPPSRSDCSTACSITACCGFTTRIATPPKKPLKNTAWLPLW